MPTPTSISLSIIRSLQQRAAERAAAGLAPEEHASIATYLDTLMFPGDGDVQSEPVPAIPALASLPTTPNPSLPPLAGNVPTRALSVTVMVPADWEKRLDMQWVLEREIHADRWNWEWADEKEATIKALIEAGNAMYNADSGEIGEAMNQWEDTLEEVEGKV